MSTTRAQHVLLFLVVEVNSTRFRILPGFEFYVVTRYYSSCPFFCALGYTHGKSGLHVVSNVNLKIELANGCMKRTVISVHFSLLQYAKTEGGLVNLTT